MKFGNKIWTKHVVFQRNKMNVKPAAQVLSSSVADAIDFLRYPRYENSHHEFRPDSAFENSKGNTNFIRIIDRLFDLLNSRKALAKGFKKPLRLAEREQWLAVVDESINYLHGLKDELKYVSKCVRLIAIFAII